MPSSRLRPPLTYSLAAFAFAIWTAASAMGQSSPAAAHYPPPALPGNQPQIGKAAASAVPAGQRPALKFAAAVANSSGGSGAYSVATGDLRGNGKLDVVVANGGWSESCGSGNSSDGVVSVLLGNGDGTFEPAVCYDSGAPDAVSVAIGDVNGDGLPDLMVANVCQSDTSCDNGGVSVLLGNGDGTFQPAVSYASGGYYASSVAIADLRGNGRADLVVSSQCPAGACTGAQGVVSVLLGNGDGTFQPAVTYSPGGFYAMSVAAADVNGDGRPDLVVANKCLNSCSNSFGIGGVSVLLGNGDGTFQAPVSYASGGYNTSSVAVSDVNGDGRPDVVVTNLCQDANCDGGEVSVLVGNGDGTFQPAVGYSSGKGDAEFVAVADVNGDGKPDLAVVNCSANSYCSGRGAVSVLVGNGDGTFQAPARFAAGGGKVGTSVAIADVNRDGRPDLLVASMCMDRCVNRPNGTVGLLLNELFVTTRTVVTASPDPSQVNQPVTFTATMTSASSVPDGSVVTFYNGATEIGTATTTKGVATLTTSFSTPGKYTIKAIYPGDAFHKGSSGTVKQVVKS